MAYANVEKGRRRTKLLSVKMVKAFADQEALTRILSEFIIDICNSDRESFGHQRAAFLMLLKAVSLHQ